MKEKELTALILNAKFRLQRDSHPHKEGLTNSLRNWMAERESLRMAIINAKKVKK